MDRRKLLEMIDHISVYLLIDCIRKIRIYKLINDNCSKDSLVKENSTWRCLNQHNFRSVNTKIKCFTINITGKT